MKERENGYHVGKKLLKAIQKAGFEINEKKTRIQYKDSRQDVTGLIVNKKVGVKREYWRTVKSQCHSLFSTGAFIKTTADGDEEGNINELEGQLNFIDSIDRHNRLLPKPKQDPTYKYESYGHKTSALHNGREKTFSRFLYYRLFYGNESPTIICEGKTDNVYFKSAINRLVNDYPLLAKVSGKNKSYQLLIRFLEYTKRTRFLLELYGGTSYLSFFINNFKRRYDFYKATEPEHPIIIVMDNDDGPKNILNEIVSKKHKACLYPRTLSKTAINCRQAEFIHVMHNLYIVLTLSSTNNGDTAVEDFFDTQTRAEKVGNKTFNPDDKKRDNKTEYGKEIFAKKVIHAQKNNIDFDGLKPILDRIVKAIEHYDSIN